MTITLTPEHERIIQAQIASGRFRSPEEVVGEALALLRPQDTETAATANHRGGGKARAFEEWADSFPDTPPLSDEAISRESIYPDRW